MTGHPSFLLQPKLIWLAVLCSNYCFYDFNDKISKFFLRFWDIFVLLVTFELLSRYPKIDSSHWLKKTFSRLQMKFSEKSLCFNWLRHFLLAFSYWVFGFCQFLLLFFVVIRLIVALYWLTMHDKYFLSPIGAYRSVFIDFRWKLLNLMANKSLKNNFLKNFKTLTNLKPF